MYLLREQQRVLHIIAIVSKPSCLCRKGLTKIPLPENAIWKGKNIMDLNLSIIGGLEQYFDQRAKIDKAKKDLYKFSNSNVFWFKWFVHGM